MAPIPPAKLIAQSKDHVRTGKISVTELWFEVPLNYANPAPSETLKLFATTTRRFERPTAQEASADEPKRPKPFLAFLPGGPGRGNSAPQDSPLSAFMLDRGYEVIFIDYRGTGLSSAVSDATLARFSSPDEKATYLQNFRTDTIAKDLEAIRRCLVKDYPPNLQKWSIFGVSFGGSVSLSYLSFHPEGLRESFIVAGLQPLNKPSDEVYTAMYRRLIGRNEAYYAKYPADALNVQEIVWRIEEIGGSYGIMLPNGGRLTKQRFLSLGFQLGADGGLDRLHDLVIRIKADLDIFNLMTLGTLTAIEQTMPWDTVPLFSMHESFAVSGPGMSSNWSADRVGKSLPEFPWLHENWKVPGPPPLKDTAPLYFSGGMVYPFVFDTCPELTKLKETADILAKHDAWPRLYDEEQLGKNEVPVFAALFEDMYVDRDMGREVAAKIKGLRLYETNTMSHSAFTTRSAHVMRELLQLRDDVTD